jgi:glutaredoxin
VWTAAFARLAAATALAATLSAPAGCRARNDAQLDEVGPGSRMLRVGDGQAVEYLDLSGRFELASDAEWVPATCRGALRLVGAASGLSDDVVQVADLRTREAAKTAPMSRIEFEAAAYARLPAAQGSRFPWPGAAVAGDGRIAREEVMMFSTSWCSACRRGRELLRASQVGFREVDIERDADAAASLARAVRSTLGVELDRVPVLVHRGRVLVGFDELRWKAVLGEPL